MEKVFVDNLIDIGRIDIAIPDALWVDHHDRAFVTSIKASRTINSNLAGPVFLQGLDSIFCVRLQVARTTVRATGGPIFTLVNAEKNVFLEITHGPILSRTFVLIAPPHDGLIRDPGYGHCDG